MAIQYVGGQVAGRAGATSALSVNFALTGGLAAVPAAGDLVIITAVVGSQARNPAQAIVTPTGYTALGQLNPATGTYDTSMNVSWKFMGSTPDTSFTLPSTGNIADAQRYTVQVFRGVDEITPMDATPVAASAGNVRAQPNPGSITPVTAGAWVVICGGGAAATGVNYTAPTNFTTNFLTGFTADTNDAQIGSGYWTGWTSGAVDPGVYGGGSTTVVDSWAAYTLALRPNLAVNATATPAGAETTTSAGAATASGTVNATATPSGAQSAASAGNVIAEATSDATATPAGAQASASAGTVTASGLTVVDATATPLGAAATTSVGGTTVAGGATQEVTGATTTASAGATTQSGEATTAPLGAQVTAEAGTVSAIGGSVVDATATPDGAQAGASAGTANATGSATAAAPGAQAQALAGDAAAAGSAQVALTGALAQAQAGAAAADNGVGVTITTAQANLIYQIALLHGLDPTNPLTVSAAGRSAGTLIQTIAGTDPVTIHTVSAPPLSGDAGQWIEALAALHGLTDDLIVTSTSRVAGAVAQTLATDGTTTTVESA